MSRLGGLVAVKRILAESELYESLFVNEVKIISRLKHRNLVQLMGWCHEKDELLLVYEYMQNGSLDYHPFGNQKPLPWSIRYKIALGLPSALRYLHEEAEPYVLHRDIKSANVLLNTDFSTKLGDFGVAKVVNSWSQNQATNVVGTVGYLAPEYLRDGRATKESDMFSFGIVSLEIACGRRADREPLIKSVWELYKAGNIIQAADTRLEMKFESRELECLLIVGLWCTHPVDMERPSAGQVIQLLNFEATLPELPQELHDPAFVPRPLSPDSDDSSEA
ncbi:L-type lectin-domain containing receptor kinase IX.1-like [Pistacia vera]|nr:L-type lectin-domain containing receptor kinase IX.1-like [Pistacia vera]